MRATIYACLIIFGFFVISEQLEDFSYNSYQAQMFDVIENDQLKQLLKIATSEETALAILVNDKTSVRSEINDKLKYLLEHGFYKSDLFLLRFNNTDTHTILSFAQSKVFVYNKYGVDITSGSSKELLSQLFEEPFVGQGENTVVNAYFAMLKAVRIIPYNGTVMLFTDDNIADKQLIPQVVKELLSKNIKLYIIWKSANSDNVNVDNTNLSKIALLSGGDYFTNVLLTNNSIGYFRNEQVLFDGNLIGLQEYNISFDHNSKCIRFMAFGNLTSIKFEFEGKQIDLLNQEELNDYPGSFVLSWEGRVIIIFYPESGTVGIYKLVVDANTRAKLSINVRTEILNSQSNNLERLTQAEIQRLNTVLPPFTIEVGTGSELLMTPGRIGVIYFAVTNNDNQVLRVQFTCTDEKSLLQRLQPTGARIDPKQTVVVTVTVTTQHNQQTGYYDTITLKANGDASAEKSTYLYVNSEKPLDVESPHLWYTFTSDCLDVLTTDCSSGSFILEIFAQDSETGLQELSTNPRGIYFPNKFVSGTKDQVLGYYAGSCCNSDVQITAVDLYGNRRVREVNAYRDTTLSAGSISAICLGIFLLILIIALCVFCIVKCCKSKDSVDLPTYRAPRWGSSSRNVH